MAKLRPAGTLLHCSPPLNEGQTDPAHSAAYGPAFKTFITLTRLPDCDRQK